MANEISAQYNKALELHNKILVSAQLAQTNLWDMCEGLKKMRDGKLYKELGYQNFEEYCETEHGFSRTNAHKYIAIVEKINRENVSSMKHFGMTKLYLLSTLSEADQEKILAENDVEKQTVKELEAEISKLKNRCEKLNTVNEHLEEDLEDRDQQIRKIKNTLEDVEDRNTELHREVNELRSRPVDVAVMEPSDDVRQLKETIKNLERTSEEQAERMENEHLADIRKLHEQNRAETQKQLDEQKVLYEEKLKAAQSNAQPSAVSNRQAFKAYFSAAYDAFDRMITFAAKSDENREFFRGKIETLVDTFATANRNM